MKNRILLSITVIFIISIIIIISTLGKNTTKNSRQEYLDERQKVESTSYTRKMSVAGQFYPSNAKDLKSQLNGLFNSTSLLPKNGKMHILVVPHAGLSYSGQTAAWGYAQIKNENYSQIIIIASDHKDISSFAYVMTEGEWETPFGNIKIDKHLAQNLLNEKNKIIANYQAHEKQHVIEMETIFIKYLFDKAKIVPIVLGNNIDEDTIQALTYNISKNLNKNTLLIVSTDLSHYPNYEDAKSADKNTIESFLTLNPNLLTQVSDYNKQQNYQNLQTSACGLKAMEIALKIALITNISDFSLINYSNSGDYSQDRDKVVGYAAIGGWSTNEPKIYIDEDSKQEIITLAKNTISDYLDNKKIADYKPYNDILNIPLGAFVTLTKNNNLRGCMGEFESTIPLYKVIQNTAILSAAKDPRFKPITKDEFDNIEFEISILSPLRKVESIEEITAGKNGVKIEINNKSGTFLPQVATDNNWDKVTFLENLCVQKLLLNKNCYQNEDANIYSYETQILKN